MAVTKGHGNPGWTRDEVILALDLYFDVEGTIPRGQDRRVQELSNLLRQLPRNYHIAVQKSSFRNPAGVSFKLQNLRHVATGQGLGNTAEVDREVWAAFGSDPTYTKTIAKQIRESLLAVQTRDEPDLDFEFPEGRTLTLNHLQRERNPKLRLLVLKERRLLGPLTCEICGRASSDFSQTLGDAVFECHHLLPLGAGVERLTRAKDLALLCANCHRLVHCAIAREGRWLPIDEARVLVAR